MRGWRSTVGDSTGAGRVAPKVGEVAGRRSRFVQEAFVAAGTARIFGRHVGRGRRALLQQLAATEQASDDRRVQGMARAAALHESEADPGQSMCELVLANGGEGGGFGRVGAVSRWK